MRVLYLLNQNDQRYDLMANFLNEPKGLGFSFNLDYATFSLVKKATRKRIKFQQITGDLILRDYLGYQEFMAYLRSSTTLTLTYIPSPEIGPYYCPMEVSSLSKTEVSKETGLLHCPIVFDQLGYWTHEEVLVFGESMEVSTVEEYYPLRYPLAYGKSPNTPNLLSIAIRNDGDVPCPLKLSLFGQGIQPTWKLGEQEGGLNLTILTDQVVHIDSREDVMLIYSGETLLDAMKDHTKQNYLYAPVGESTLEVSNVARAEVILYEQFLSV